MDNAAYQLKCGNEKLMGLLEHTQHELKALRSEAAVSREAFNAAVEGRKKAEDEVAYLQGVLEREHVTSLGYRRQIETFHEFASCSPVELGAQRPSLLSDLPSVGRSDCSKWAFVVGRHTYGFLRRSNLLHLLPTIQSVVQFTSPSNWCQFLKPRIPPQDVTYTSQLLLALGMDLLSGSLPSQ
ncbi:hypothetical protein FISHEDRAFT_68741 [Fistulina hepatica ATCC 64428]|uniref:Uncharacterized protein n=1 Tax=Fistulina hepatica ATCC 64428 TaxID=1128425 RepID=A0A0D7AP68_9AGAR|nr:hypothetical protein FISHEDRAFT_68741 [Fistulina hepatica ATCC 64428]